MQTLQQTSGTCRFLSETLKELEIPILERVLPSSKRQMIILGSTFQPGHAEKLVETASQICGRLPAAFLAFEVFTGEGTLAEVIRTSVPEKPVDQLNLIGLKTYGTLLLQRNTIGLEATIASQAAKALGTLRDLTAVIKHISDLTDMDTLLLLDPSSSLITKLRECEAEARKIFPNLPELPKSDEELKEDLQAAFSDAGAKFPSEEDKQMLSISGPGWLRYSQKIMDFFLLKMAHERHEIWANKLSRKLSGEMGCGLLLVGPEHLFVSPLDNRGNEATASVPPALAAKGIGSIVIDPKYFIANFWEDWAQALGAKPPAEKAVK